MKAENSARFDMPCSYPVVRVIRPHLQTLDLTGCTAVTDQSILFLCEGTYVSLGLRNLLLAGCTKITDTALSWISEGLKTADGDGSLTLLTLSLKKGHALL